MAKKRTPLTDKNIKRMIKEGKGQGNGVEYIPWLAAKDVPSLGCSKENKGWKTGRIHHFLSKLETKYFYQLEWADNVIDIREQFPLLDKFGSYGETMEIAKQIGVKYSIVPKTRTPNVMTTDFLITLNVSGKKILMARSTKYAKDLSDTRTKEKLEVERLFWERRDVESKLITENQIDEALVFNVWFVHGAKTLLGYKYITNDMIYYVEKRLRTTDSFADEPLVYWTKQIDKDMNFKKGTSLCIVRYLIANKIWGIDMTRKIEPTEPLAVKTVTIFRREEDCI